MFIIGLPRSRTAWLSAFMCQSTTHFYHEAINGCYNLDDYDKKIIGCGDSTTAFHLLLDRLKGQKVVIIKKNNEQLSRCIDWCDSEYKINCSDQMKRMDSLLDTINGIVVNQLDIDSELERIWRYLVDDEWLEKYADFSKFNIQVKDTSIDVEAAKSLYESIQ